MKLNDNKMKGFITYEVFMCIVIILLILAFILSSRNTQNKIKITEIEVQQEQFSKDYIKKNPEMIPVINAYLVCDAQKVKVIEGCVDHTVKNDTDKQKLESYLKSLSEIYVKGLE